jgi:hypothetical protein
MRFDLGRTLDAHGALEPEHLIERSQNQGRVSLMADLFKTRSNVPRKKRDASLALST